MVTSQKIINESKLMGEKFWHCLLKEDWLGVQGKELYAVGFYSGRDVSKEKLVEVPL